MKIQNTITLDDGQRIHVIGKIYPRTLFKYMNEIRDDAFINNWSIEQHCHFAMKSFVKEKWPTLYKWLSQYQAKVTIWVDPLFQKVRTDVYADVDWGLGFGPNDSLETMFILRWS